MIAPHASWQHAWIRGVVIIDADIDKQRRVRCSDKAGELSNSDGVGRGHERPFPLFEVGDAILRPKPHGAIAVSPLPAKVVEAVLGVKNGHGRVAEQRLRTIA